MKLLFLWINCSKNGYIKKRGFNIAGKYIWKYDDKKKLLSFKNKEGYIEQFWNEQNNNIEDLSVIVGANGSGKSTLLSEIMRYSAIVPEKLMGKHESKAADYREEMQKKLIVYEEEGYIYYDHNLGYEIETYPIVCRKKVDALQNCTKIFVSNSMGTPVKLSLFQGGDVLEYVLTDYVIGEQAGTIIGKNKIPDYIYSSEKRDDSRYYDDPSAHHEEKRYIDRASKLNNELDIQEDSYKNLNNLIRLYFLERSTCKRYAGKTYQYVTIRLKEIYSVFGEKGVENRKEQKNKIWNQVMALEQKEKNNILNSLMVCFFMNY